MTIDELIEKAVYDFTREVPDPVSFSYVLGWLHGYWSVAISHHAELGGGRGRFLEGARNGIVDQWRKSDARIEVQEAAR